MKKGNIPIEYLIALLIGLIALIIVIAGFARQWGRGEDNVDDIFEFDFGFENQQNEDNQDSNIIFLIPTGLLTKYFWRKKNYVP